MESTFTLPYSEYEAIIQMQHLLKKKDGYSFYIPTTRQQKGIDLIIHNSQTNKILRVQVKSSRSYVNTSERKKENDYRYYLWFNNFLKKFQLGMADFYLLFGLFPRYDSKYKIKSKNEFWSSVILLFDDKEMNELLKNVKTKKEKKMDKFFGFGFDSDDSIYGVRGFEEPTDFSKYLLKHRLDSVKLFLS